MKTNQQAGIERLKEFGNLVVAVQPGEHSSALLFDSLPFPWTPHGPLSNGFFEVYDAKGHIVMETRRMSLWQVEELCRRAAVWTPE